MAPPADGAGELEARAVYSSATNVNAQQQQQQQQQQRGFERPLEVLFPSASMRRLVKVLVVVGIAMIASVVVTHPAALVFGSLVAALGVVLGHDVRRNNTHARALRALVRVDEGALVVDGKTILARADVREALLVPPSAAAPLRVRLIGRRGNVAFEANVDDEVTADDLLGALGVARHRSTFRGESALVRRAVLPVVVAVVLVVGFGGSLIVNRIAGAHDVSMGPAALGLLIVTMIVASITSTIEIGDDGVSSRWLGRRRFVPLHRIRSTTPLAEDTIEIELEAGERLRLVFEARRNENRRAGVRRERDAALRRLEDAIARSADRSPALLGARLSRSGRDVRVWLEELRGVAAEAGFRAAAIPSDALWQVLEDSSMSEDARAGAAVVLLVGDPEGARDRLRTFAENIASPTLRAALRSAADGKSDELARELQRLGDAAA